MHGDDSDAVLNAAAAQIAATPKKKLLIHRFPGNGSERMECVNWLVNACVGYKDSPDIEVLFPRFRQDTPIDMVRNEAVLAARRLGADYLCLVDSDIEPDYQCGGFAPAADFQPDAKQFLPSSLKFLRSLPGPAVVAAPYCGPPPAEYVYVFDWDWTGNVERPDFRGKIEMIPRNDAAHRTGFQQVAALPTGLMLIDMRVFDIVPGPWFYYETDCPNWSRKASTEDVTFSRDCAMCRVPIYCNWDSWCRHWKTVGVGKPLRASMDIVNPRIAEIVAAGYRRDERVKFVGQDAPAWPDWLPQSLPVGGASKKAPVVMVG